MTSPTAKHHPKNRTKTSNRQYHLRVKAKSKKRPVPKSKYPTNRSFLDHSETRKVQAVKPNFERHKDGDKNTHLGGELTDIPNPVPDTGFRPTQTQALDSPETLSTFNPHLPATTKTNPPLAAFSSFPPITSLGFPMNPAPLSTSLAAPTLSGSFGPDPLIQTASAAPSEPYQAFKARRLSAPIIVLLAVVSVGLLGSLFLVLKYCYRPKRHPRPKPSLPILDDSFADDKSDSPIFGGKERLSSRPGSTGLWAWTQYPSGSKKSQTTGDSSSGDHLSGYGAVSRSPRMQAASPLSGRESKPHFRFPGHSRTYSAPDLAADSPYQPSLQQVRSALSRATSRISAASMSLYPASPQVSNSDVGIAIGSASPGTVLTGDGHDVLKRTDCRTSLERSRSNVNETKTRQHSQGAAYGGADIASPTFLPYATSQAAPTITRGGRTRIKSSYYTPGSYPRVSHLHSSSTGKPGGSEQHKQPPIPGSKGQESRALPCGLGLTSPESDLVRSSYNKPYKDTSAIVTVADVKRPRKPGHQRKIPDKDGFPVIKTAVEASAALGSLVDLTMTQGSRRLSTNKGSATMPEIRIQGPTKDISRTDDKPPYIPLPAPLPSLAQMAMEHTNPQFCAEYRSPTYSIYGLYECERKKGGY